MRDVTRQGSPYLAAENGGGVGVRSILLLACESRRCARKLACRLYPPWVLSGALSPTTPSCLLLAIACANSFLIPHFHLISSLFCTSVSLPLPPLRLHTLQSDPPFHHAPWWPEERHADGWTCSHRLRPRHLFECARDHQARGGVRAGRVQRRGCRFLAGMDACVHGHPRCSRRGC